VNKKTLEKI